MNRLIVLTVLVLTSLGLCEAQEQQKPRDVTIVGEVIDSKCYFTQGDAGRGEQHKECALQCARGGIPLAILEEKTDIVYFAAKARGMGSANEMLIPFVSERVKVKGKLIERGKARMLMIETVEGAN